MKKFLKLMINDIRNMTREPMFILMTIGPFILALIGRYGIPVISRKFKPYINLAAHYNIISAYFLAFPALLIGVMIGLLLLDEKDDGVHLALMTTPLEKKGYIAYRLLFPTIISFFYAIVILPIVGFTSISFIPTLLIATMMSLEAPMAALFISSFASNKIEGLTLSKTLSVLILSPLLGYILKSIWRWTGAIFPYYWSILSVVRAVEGGIEFWLFIVIGMINHILILTVLIKRFNRNIC
ncbi:hypothetical protein [Alkaliphilus sp. B6464]|uniref:hypothetical protein n=1 Tax=Alkaliphilus sp. B6464 TaxID=2731219 RepID=UPI001BAD93CE|nr:hypothetical protein [Alkaliphilus sp. B6464]QUH19655.1 hypothetical protein HYG84_06930 [Alkaliphilus sp. B6464]